MEENLYEKQPASNDDEAVASVYQYAANLLINQKLEPGDVIDSLVKQGLSQETATIVVQNLEDQINTARRSKAKKDMLYGGLWLVGGAIVTLVTIANASGGGSYVVTWGAIIFGGVQFFRGLSNLS